MASNPPADLLLQPLTGKGFPISAWLVQYQLLFVVLDPFTNESAWALPTAVRILHNFEQSDCRVGVVLAGADADEAKQFLGPKAKDFLCFPDPDRTIVRSFGLERLPAIVHVGSDGAVCQRTCSPLVRSPVTTWIAPRWLMAMSVPCAPRSTTVR